MASSTRNIKRMAFILVSVILAACASTETATGPTAEPAAPVSKSEFSNFLVIGVAGDYNTRAQFERMAVSQIRKTGASASPWYSVIGGNKPIAREDLIAAVDDQQFDAVMVVRRLDGDVELQVTEDRSTTNATTIGGRFVNLFRTDYSDYKVPGSVNLATNAMLAVDIYDAATEEIVYSFEHETGKETNLGLLIDQTAEAVVKRIDREELIAN